MKNINQHIYLIVILFLLQSCAIQRSATTVERDKEDGCTVHIIMQIGIDGNDSDVIEVRDRLNECYAQECLIPCSNNAAKGCKIKTNMIVEKWANIPAKDRSTFHHIQMVNDDHKPSFVDTIGIPNGKATGGTWRRHAHPKTYCHEVLHLMGLDDQYCSRLFDTVNNRSIQELTCHPGPDPNSDTCCDPRIVKYKRCSSPCVGHETDLMATLSFGVTCQNLLDVVKVAGLNNCPDKCCEHYNTGFKPNLNFKLGLRYTLEDSKPDKFSTTGASFGLSYPVHKNFELNANYGFTGGTHNDVKYNKSTILGGISWFPLGIESKSGKPFQIIPSLGLLGGSTTLKSSISSYSNSSSAFTYWLYAEGSIPFYSPVKKTSAAAFINVGLMHTSFNSTGQNNINIDAGIKIGLK